MPRFADTNVLLYAASTAPGDVDKRATADRLLKDEEVILSVQVLQEFYHQAMRPNRPHTMSHDTAIEFLNNLTVLRIQDMTLDLFRRATAICQRYQISYWDGAIIAAAQVSGCDVVYSEDLNHGQDYGGVRVVNPFAASPT